MSAIGSPTVARVRRRAWTPRRLNRARQGASAGFVTGAFLLALLSGCGAPAAAPAGTDPATGAASGPVRSGSAPGPTGPPTGTPTATPAPPVPDIPRRSADLSGQPAPVSAPVRVRVAALGIDQPIEAVGLDDNDAMALPANPAVAAWYRYGPGPGSDAGATVIAAHVDSLTYGLGPFARLADAPTGTEVVLSTADGGEHRYAVASVESMEKPSVPWGSVFDRSGEPRLTLVTCGGEFDYDARLYLSNVIVTAVPVP